MMQSYIVEDAKLVSSCFSCPSNAKPRLSLLLASRGLTWYTFERVKPGLTGHPALLIKDTYKIEWCYQCKIKIR